MRALHRSFPQHIRNCILLFSSWLGQRMMRKPLAWKDDQRGSKEPRCCSLPWAQQGLNRSLQEGHKPGERWSAVRKKERLIQDFWAMGPYHSVVHPRVSWWEVGLVCRHAWKKRKEEHRLASWAKMVGLERTKGGVGYLACWLSCWNSSERLRRDEVVHHHYWPPSLSTTHTTHKNTHGAPASQVPHLPSPAKEKLFSSLSLSLPSNWSEEALTHNYETQTKIKNKVPTLPHSFLCRCWLNNHAGIRHFPDSDSLVTPECHRTVPCIQHTHSL